MGQKFSQTKENIVIKVFLDKYFPNFKLMQVLNNGIMYKTLLIKKEKAPLVVKIFTKKNYDENDIKSFSIEKDKLKSIYKKIFTKKIPPSIAPIINITDLPLSGMIFRQYFEYSLKERIYLNPYLTEIEKIWITFQLLYTLNELNELGLVHGDLNPENILLTSNLSVYISDIASYKPAYINIDDIASYTYYFGSNDNTSLKGFYLAPERLAEKGNTSDNNKNIGFDVFSLGVIIAELFIEKNIFSFSSMLNYKKGKKELFDIEEYLKKIKNKKIKKLIYEMIKVDPSERISISFALNYFSEEVAPLIMKGFLIHYNMIINNTDFWKPDLIIGYFYRFWNAIWKMIFGMNDTPLILKKKLNLEIINQLILNNPINQIPSKSILKADEKGIYYYGFNKFILNVVNGELLIDKNKDNNKDILDEEKEENNKNCVLIIINYLLKNMKNVKYETSNLVAMEMVKNLSAKLPDIFKLKNIIPYFVDNLRRKSFTTIITSLNYIFEILYSFNYNELILPVTEYNYFDSYIFPALLRLYYSESHDLILEFFNSIDKIIDLEKKFLNITLKSRIIKYKNILNSEKNKPDQINKDNNIDNNENINNNDNNETQSNNNNLIFKKNKKSQIFKDYETSLMLFKEELFRATRDLLGKINEIDILIIVIRKLPDLLSFYGKSKTSDFIKFIISNFNQTDWIIQKEILMQIPKMIITLGEKVLNDFILICMEMLITNNSNEIKTYELIKTVNELLKMGFLQHESATSIFNKLIPCLVHPNYLIRYEFIDFTKSLINYLSNNEIFHYLYKSLHDYFFIPIIEVENAINIDSILLYKRVNLDRVIYQLELKNILYENSDIFNDDNSLLLIQNMIINERKGDSLDNNNGDINYCFDGFKIDNFGNQLNNLKVYNIKDNFNEYIKYISNNTEKNAFGDKINELIGKIFWICSEQADDNKYKKNKNIFNENDSLINSNFFNFLKIFKILGISMKLFNFTKLNEIVNIPKENNNLENTSSLITINKDTHILANFYYNKSFYNWRPQGQLISTLYWHNKNPVEKLIPINNNNICSFDSKGSAILWKVSKKDDYYYFKKEWNFIPSNDENYSILYKNSIQLIDNLFFAVGSKNILYQYEPECSQNNATKLCKTKDDSNISCLETFGKSSLELQKIIFCTEKGGINIYDQRQHKIALNKNLSFEKGKPYCIREGFTKNYFYIGTSKGTILKYDLRFNSILDEYNYYNQDPILGIYPFNYSKNNINLFYNDLQSKYFIIWTANNNHEVGFWNINTLQCDLLLKVNTFKLTENKNKNLYALDVDFPLPLENINNEKYISKLENNIIHNFINMKKYTHIYNNNYIKLLSMNHSFDHFYLGTFSTLNKMNNFYKNPTTVQCISSPLCEINNQNYFQYDNCPYIITSGNDMSIRYWDLTKEGIKNINGNNLCEKGSYIINSPNNMSYCQFSKNAFYGLTVLQSNESFEYLDKKKNMPGFSEYQNYNGITYHSVIQNEFDPNSDLKFCTKISEVSHKGIISDLLSYSIYSNEGQSNILVSSSWDGTIKIWK